MLHEEEFFDAIDATLDKWDKEEEKVSSACINLILSHLLKSAVTCLLPGLEIVVFCSLK